MCYVCVCCGEILTSTDEVVLVENGGKFKRIDADNYNSDTDVIMCDICYIEELDSINYTGISRKYINRELCEC